MTNTKIEVILNGTPKVLESDSDMTLEQGLKELGYEDNMSGLAVAVNDTVVPKHEWPEHKLDQGDRLEVIKAVQGG